MIVWAKNGSDGESPEDGDAGAERQPEDTEPTLKTFATSVVLMKTRECGDTHVEGFLALNEHPNMAHAKGAAVAMALLQVPGAEVSRVDSVQVDLLGPSAMLVEALMLIIGRASKEEPDRSEWGEDTDSAEDFGIELGRWEAATIAREAIVQSAIDVVIEDAPHTSGTPEAAKRLAHYALRNAKLLLLKLYRDLMARAVSEDDVGNRVAEIHNQVASKLIQLGDDTSPINPPPPGFSEGGADA